jgi:hypothetical protein
LIPNIAGGAYIALSGSLGGAYLMQVAKKATRVINTIVKKAKESKLSEHHIVKKAKESKLSEHHIVKKAKESKLKTHKLKDSSYPSH